MHDTTAERISLALQAINRLRGWRLWLAVTLLSLLAATTGPEAR